MSSVTHSERARPPRLKAFWVGLLRFWSSVRLAVVLILAIAIASILGTIVPQGDPSAITNSQMSPLAKQIMLALQAHNVYYSNWFLTLLALFFINLAAGTYVLVLPRLRAALKGPAETSVEGQRQHPDQILVQASMEQVAAELSGRRYRILSSHHGLRADKGRRTRWAPTIVHIGLFTILIGGIYSGLSGYKAAFPLFPGQSVSMKQVMGVANPRGVLASDHRDWSIRLDKFWMEYWDADTVKQFYSTLTVVDKTGKELGQHKIWVNEPLVHDGVYFYQSFWGVGAVHLDLGGAHKTIEMADAERFKLEGTLSRRVEIGGKGYFLYLKDPRQPLQIIDLGTFQPVAVLMKGQETTIGGQAVKYEEPILYSGLQTKNDPGLPVVYTGFIIIMAGTMLAFFNHRQVWVGRTEDGILISGKANRGRYAFQQELRQIAARLGAAAHEPRSV